MTDKTEDRSCFFCKWSGSDAECSEINGTCEHFQRKTLDVIVDQIDCIPGANHD